MRSTAPLARSPSRSALARVLALAAVTAGAACSGPVVTVEVLPPRTSLSCTAPGPDDPALGRGLLDAKATTSVHGGYQADLRMVVSAANARVDGIDVKLSRDGAELKVLLNVPTGDVVLVGSGDDVRKAVVENVELIPRSVAVDLAKDTKITDLEFATIVAEISPRVIDTGVVPESSTFALDVCNGCLVTPPNPCGAVVRNPVCRVGQDVPLFSCPGGAP